MKGKDCGTNLGLRKFQDCANVIMYTCIQVHVYVYTRHVSINIILCLIIIPPTAQGSSTIDWEIKFPCEKFCVLNFCVEVDRAIQENKIHNLSMKISRQHFNMMAEYKFSVCVCVCGYTTSTEEGAHKIERAACEQCCPDYSQNFRVNFRGSSQPRTVIIM